MTINEPGHEAEIEGNEVKVRGRVVAANKIVKIEIFINDEIKETIENGSRFEKIFTLEDGTYTIRVKAEDEKGNKGEREAKIGVNVPWDWVEPTPTPSLSPSPTPTPP